MKISLVTISYNQCAFLGQALASVLDQGYPELEYIVVDPGSTDGSRDLIAAHRERLTCAILEPDKGPSDGLNKGFSKATGDIFCFLNADDLLLPGALDLVAKYFQENPDCDVLMGSGFMVDEHARVLQHVLARPYSPERYFSSRTRWLQQSTFFRREAFLRVGGFNVLNRTCWDGELFLYMAVAGAKFQSVPSYDLGAFRVHGASLSVVSNLTSAHPAAQAYTADIQRLFEHAKGRPQASRDRLQAELFRLGYSIYDIENTSQTILSRIRQKFPNQDWLRPSLTTATASNPKSSR
jgi:glycosyltransferase involved in cell wall biosynthesis